MKCKNLQCPRLLLVEKPWVMHNLNGTFSDKSKSSFALCVKQIIKHWSQHKTCQAAPKLNLAALSKHRCHTSVLAWEHTIPPWPLVSTKTVSLPHFHDILLVSDVQLMPCSTVCCCQLNKGDTQWHFAPWCVCHLLAAGRQARLLLLQTETCSLMAQAGAKIGEEHRRAVPAQQLRGQSPGASAPATMWWCSGRECFAATGSGCLHVVGTMAQ